ncbi:hypothetical protein EYC84_008368 [Monilinia fructicola]|uniref:Uncharacterized protein n=1 Tax=Monilinia fructicola TaxID=38448 RepID=A0A5M9JGZ3_MONFR|nr:hypothetical protein EYC84_008368 [Monilinia fructicola]
MRRQGVQIGASLSKEVLRPPKYYQNVFYLAAASRLRILNHQCANVISRLHRHDTPDEPPTRLPPPDRQAPEAKPTHHRRGRARHEGSAAGSPRQGRLQRSARPSDPGRRHDIQGARLPRRGGPRDEAGRVGREGQPRGSDYPRACGHGGAAQGAGDGCAGAERRRGQGDGRAGGGELQPRRLQGSGAGAGAGRGQDQVVEEVPGDPEGGASGGHGRGRGGACGVDAGRGPEESGSVDGDEHEDSGGRDPERGTRRPALGQGLEQTPEETPKEGPHHRHLWPRLKTRSPIEEVQHGLRYRMLEGRQTHGRRDRGGELGAET